MIIQCNFLKFDKMVETGYSRVDPGENYFDKSSYYFLTILKIKPKLSLTMDFKTKVGLGENNFNKFCVQTDFIKPMIVFRLLLDKYRKKVGRVFINPMNVHAQNTFNDKSIIVNASNEWIEYILEAKFGNDSAYQNYAETVVEYNLFETVVYMSEYINTFLFDEKKKP